MRQPNTGPNAVPATVVANPGAQTGRQAQQGGNTGGAPQPTAASRIQESLSQIPLATLFFLAFNIGLYLLTATEVLDSGDYACSAYNVIFKFQWYRMITFNFFHLSLMHIAMNMMTLYYSGIGLERLFGTVQFFIFTWMFVLLDGVLYVASNAFLTYGLFRDVSWIMQPSAGYSGVLFTYTVLQTTLSTATSMSLMGLVTVPAKVYPWAMLIALQVLMPNISFMGHLSGLLVGFVFMRGWLNWWLPSRAMIETIENSGWVTTHLRTRPNFIPCSDASFQWNPRLQRQQQYSQVSTNDASSAV